MEEYGLNYYSYIQNFPYYIHNDNRNLINTARTIYDGSNSGEKDLSKHPYIRKMLEYQIKREDDILKQLGQKDEESLLELFERVGLIEKDSLQEKLIKKLDEIKESEAYREELDIRKIVNDNKTQIKKDSSINKINLKDFQFQLEKIFEDFKKEIERITIEMKDIINEYENSGGNEISLRLFQKLKEYSDKEFSSDSKDYADKLFKYVNGLQGKMSNYYKSIMEDTRKASYSQIAQTMKEGYVLIEDVDTLRSKQVKNAFRLAKADKLIGKVEGNLVIPIGGITAKKAVDKKVKLNDTSSVESFMESIKRNAGYINDNEVNRDLKEFEYLIRNAAFHNFRTESLGPVSRALSYFGAKYSYGFLANGIFREIIEQDISDTEKFKSLQEILNYEHGDFLFAILNGNTIIKRVSTEIQEAIKNSTISIGSNYNIGDRSVGPRAQMNKAEAEKILKDILDIKSKIKPFSYEDAIKNSLLIDRMEAIKNTMLGVMQITVNMGVSDG